MNENSGAQWVARFPTDRSLQALAMPFRTKAVAFINAMKKAGMSVDISAVYRPAERAYLMHYAYQIANGQINPANVPPMAGVNINWQTGGAAVGAAQAMVDSYGIAYPPVLASRHTQRLAIDMTISWFHEPIINKPDGSIGRITSFPRDGGNADLQHIGSLYGVIKLESDPPHWSNDGH